MVWIQGVGSWHWMTRPSLASRQTLWTYVRPPRMSESLPTECGSKLLLNKLLVRPSRGRLHSFADLLPEAALLDRNFFLDCRETFAFPQSSSLSLISSSGSGVRAALHEQGEVVFLDHFSTHKRVRITQAWGAGYKKISLGKNISKMIIQGENARTDLRARQILEQPLYFWQKMNPLHLCFFETRNISTLGISNIHASRFSYLTGL